MAELVFKGIQLITGTVDMKPTAITKYDKQILYFVRTNTAKTDGYLVFNNKKYATGEDLKKALISGETTYTNLKKVGDALRSLDSAITGMDYSRIVGDKAVSTASTASGNVVTVGITQVNGKITGHTVTVKTADLGLNGIKMGSDGKWVVNDTALTSVGLAKAANVSATIVNNEKVVAAALNNLNDKITKEIADRATAITAAIESLDASVSGSSNYVTVSVDEADGKLTSLSLTVETGAMLATNDFTYNSTTGKYSGRTVSNVSGLAKIENIDQRMAADEAVIAAALNKLSTALTDNELTIVKQGTAESGMASTYYLAKKSTTGTTIGSKINIPLDKVLKKVTLIEKKTAADEPTGDTYPIGHKYLKFEFQNQDKPIYVDVHDLQDEIHAVSSTTSIKMGFVASSAVTSSTIYSEIQNQGVETKHIKDANVTTAKLADSAVTTAKIDGSAVTTTKIADKAVTTNKINDSAVTTVKIADKNVTEAKLADSAVTTDKIAKANVTRVKLAADVTSSLTLADTAIQKVNGKTGDSVNHAVVLNGNDIAIGKKITSVTTIDSSKTLVETAEILASDIKTLDSDVLKSITSTGGSLTVGTKSSNAVNIEINKEVKSEGTVAAGHIELVQNTGGTKTVYAQMYFSGEDVEQ